MKPLDRWLCVALIVCVVIEARGAITWPDGLLPIPNPAPFPADGLHVLIVEETLERSKLPKEQLAIITSTEVRAWLDANTKGLRILDQHAPMQNDDKVWQEAMKVPRESVPWLAVSNGRTGYTGPLPKDTTEFLQLVGKHKDG